MIGRTNTGGGGLIDSDAILRVIAPAGSVVTISRGGVSKSDNGHENASDNTLYDYYFIIHQSQFSATAWTVTATLGGSTATGSVVINSSDEYDVTLMYSYYLVDSGTLTGEGITKLKTSNTTTQKTGYVRFTDTTNNTLGIFSSTDAVDLTNYNTLTITVTGSSSFSYGGNNNVPVICIGSTRPTSSGGSSDVTGITAYTKLGTGSNVNIAAGTYTLDISSYSGLYYFALCAAGTSNTKFIVDVTQFGLEA